MIAKEPKDLAPIPHIQFLKASSSGDLHAIKLLLEDKTLKIDVNHKDESGMTAFHKAAQAGHCTIVDYLLAREDIEPNLVTPEGFSALHFAAFNGHHNMVKLLLTAHEKLHVNVNLKAHIANIMPLHFGAISGSIPVVELLLKAGADASTKFDNSQTPLDIAVHGGLHELSMFMDGLPQSMNMSLVQRMKALGYHSNSEGVCNGLAEVALLAALDSEESLAAFYNIVFLIKQLKAAELVNMKAKHEKIIEDAKQNALTELNVASESQLNELEKKKFRELTIKYLHCTRGQLTQEELKQEQQYISILALFDGIELEHRGEEYLHLSTQPFLKNQIHNSTWVSPLIRPNLLNKKGGEKLITIFTGVFNRDELKVYFQTLRTRLRANSKLTQPVVLALNCPTHVISIIYNPLVDSWRIINSDSMPFNAQELKEQTFYGDLELTEGLTQSLLSETGYSILRTRVYTSKNAAHDVHCAMNLWKKDIKPLLTPTPEKVTFKDRIDATWLFEAAASGDKKAVKSLLRAGANFNAVGMDNFNILTEAVSRKRAKIVKTLLKIPNININYKKSDGNTALGSACCKGYTKIARLLLHSKTIDSNTLNNEKISPLMFATVRGYPDIVALLLKDKRTLINLQGQHDATALYIAAQNGHFAITKSLLKAGADTSIKAYDNCNLPLDAAIHYAHTDIIELLLRDEKIKKVVTNFAELDETTKRYLAIKTLYTSVLDALNDDEVSILIENFVALDQLINSPQCKKLDPATHKKIQDQAYQSYIKHHATQEITTQFNKATLEATSWHRSLKINFFNIPSQNAYTRISNFLKIGII